MVPNSHPETSVSNYCPKPYLPCHGEERSWQGVYLGPSCPAEVAGYKTSSVDSIQKNGLLGLGIKASIRGESVRRASEGEF